MRFNGDVLAGYLSEAPIPLALERYLEAKIFQTLRFERPILDIGCGEGLFAKNVFAEKIDTGVDLDSRELDRARELDAYEELIQTKGNAIGKPSGSYKTVFSNSVLEHIPDIEPVFGEVYRLLAPRGKFYVTIPSHLFEKYTVVYQILNGTGLHVVADKYRQFFNKFWRHYHCYEPEKWALLAKKQGFEVTQIYTYGSKNSSLLNDFCVPFSIASFLIKKLTNSWALFPRVRRLLLSPVEYFGRSLLPGCIDIPDGALVFMDLTKS
jgi:SAM-dependent methyltransferase